MILDCGEGTQHQLMRSKSVRMSRIELIMITHFHGKYCSSLTILSSVAPCYGLPSHLGLDSIEMDSFLLTLTCSFSVT